VTEVISNSGVESPRPVIVSSRIFRIGAVVFSVLAVLKLQASWRSARPTPAASNAANVSSIAGRRDSIASMSVVSRSRYAVNTGETVIGAPAVVRRSRRATAYVVSGARLIAGWITSSRSVGSSAPASGSAHRGTRSPVEVSTSTTVASSSSDAPRSVHVGRFVGSRSAT